MWTWKAKKIQPFLHIFSIIKCHANISYNQPKTNEKQIKHQPGLTEYLTERGGKYGNVTCIPLACHYSGTLSAQGLAPY